MYLNKTFILGNLTRDPEVRMTPSGVTVASFGMATNRVWKTPQGEKKEDAQFHNIVVFGRQAEVAKQYLTKGSSVLIEGRLQTTSWDAPDGTKKYRTEIIAERLQLGPRPAGRASSSAPSGSPAGGAHQPQKDQQPAAPAEVPVINIDEEINPEDIPF
ncbi:MAG: single-stranded DNA-binding protein [Candidatus Liptonbacteria bacterium]|nr:single-stranded DNA-binding protein [Candidatus Liptonbacteria bacterium]